MGKAERKQIAFFLVCVILLGIFGNLLVALAESRDGSGVGDDSEVMVDVGVTSSSVAEATTSSATPTSTPTVLPTSTPVVSPAETPPATPTSTPTVSPTS
ncbi:MAG: hypothetical protein K2J67_03495, partial [Lachnospiraceae bacterium]|nr:hypothetical protein [Lachnospiraceae bacterium]